MTDWNMDEKWWKVSKEEEYKKNKKLKSSDVDIIQQWIKKQPHLPPLNDNQIIMFLNACDFSLEQTKTSIDLNYTTRSLHPEFFSKRDLHREAIKNTMEYLSVGVIQQPLDDEFVIIFKVKDFDLSKLNVDEAIKYCFMFHDLTHLEYGSKSGYIYIVDMKFFTINLLLRLPISTIGNMLKFWQECSTYRIKAFHIVNGGHIFKRVLHLFQQFLNSELLELIYVHDNYESLKKTINIENIPSDYQGKGKSLEELSKETIGIVKQYKDWFLIEEHQRIDEKKKISHKSQNEGLQGSFRKLNLD